MIFFPFPLPLYPLCSPAGGPGSSLSSQLLPHPMGLPASPFNTLLTTVERSPFTARESWPSSPLFLALGISHEATPAPPPPSRLHTLSLHWTLGYFGTGFRFCQEHLFSSIRSEPSRTFCFLLIYISTCMPRPQRGMP